jgi:hypothetical protein
MKIYREKYLNPSLPQKRWEGAQGWDWPPHTVLLKVMAALLMFIAKKAEERHSISIFLLGEKNDGKKNCAQ